MSPMQIWLVCFLVFFGAAELYQWLQGITLPMPVFVVAGTLLAIASNADKFPKKTIPISSAAPATSSPPAASSPPPPSQHYSTTQLPKATAQPPRSISFTIRKPQHVMREHAKPGE